MANKKLQYQAASRTIFVSAAAVAVFSSFSQPLPAKAKVSQFPSIVNAPAIPKFIERRFTRFSEPLQKANLSLRLQWRTTPSRSTQIFAPFTKFSNPQFAKSTLPDELPSALFEILPPPSPPFIGFAKFTDFLIAKTSANLSYEFIFNPITLPVDTHDGGWIKKRKKKPVDALALKLEEQLKRRADIELAVYGPEIKYEIQVLRFEATPSPANVIDLAKTIASAEHRQFVSTLKQVDDDEEDELAMILKDL